MWKGEPSELSVAKGYWKAVRAKLLYVVDVIFCSIPSYGANCHYLDRLSFEASTAQCKLAKKGGSDDGVPTASSMIKSTK